MIRRRQIAASVAVAAIVTALLEQQYLFDLGSLATVWIYEVYLFDVLSVIAAILSVSAISERPWTRVHLVALVSMLTMITLVSVGFVSWLVSQGLETSVVYWRPWIWAVSLLVMASFYASPYLWHWIKWSVIGCALIASMAIIGAYALVVLGVRVETLGCLSSINSGWYCSRIIAPGGALLLPLALPSVPQCFSSRRVSGAFLTLISSAIVLSNVRSVWLATAVTVGVWFLMSVAGGRFQTQGWSALLVAGAFAGTFGLSASIQPLNSDENVTSEAQSITTPDFVIAQTSETSQFSDSGTLRWRLSLWTSLVEGMVVDPTSIVLGSMNGVSPEWDNPNAQDVRFRTSAHNEILYGLTTLGLLGALSVVVVWVVCWRLRWQMLKWAASWLWGLLIYSVLNSLPTWTWVVLGVGTAYLSDQQDAVDSASTHR